MFPRFGSLPFPTPYGVMVALGLLTALWLSGRLAASRGLPRQAVQDVLVWGCLWGLVGAKLALAALDPAAVLRSPWSILMHGGIFYGGLIAGVVAGWIVARRRGLDPLAVGDACVAGLAVGHALGRVGCFLAGCCWGRSCRSPLYL